MAADKVQFRPGTLAEPLAARGGEANASASQVAQRDLERYYGLLAAALVQVELNTEEAAVLVDALNGTIVDLDTARLLSIAVEDTLEDDRESTQDVDGPALVAKIRGWSLLQRLAVADAAERFWCGPYRAERLEAGLIAVGLVRVPA